MDVTKVVATIRLVYHLNAINAVNVAYQLNLMGAGKADRINKNHLKECFDCYERLGYILPQAFKDFKNERAL